MILLTDKQEATKNLLNRVSNKVSAINQDFNDIYSEISDLESIVVQLNEDERLAMRGFLFSMKGHVIEAINKTSKIKDISEKLDEGKKLQ